MADVNKVVLTGRICQALELKQTQGGVPVLSFTLAAKRPRVNNTTDFLNIVCWRQNAEFLARYATKGTLISVVGTLQSRKFQDQNGKNHTAIEVVADEVGIMANVQTNAGTAPTNPETDMPNFEEVPQDDDLPF